MAGNVCVFSDSFRNNKHHLLTLGLSAAAAQRLAQLGRSEETLKESRRKRTRRFLKINISPEMSGVFVPVCHFDDNSSLTLCVCFQRIISHHLLNHPTANFYKCECAFLTLTGRVRKAERIHFTSAGVWRRNNGFRLPSASRCTCLPRRHHSLSLSCHGTELLNRTFLDCGSAHLVIGENSCQCQRAAAFPSTAKYKGIH